MKQKNLLNITEFNWLPFPKKYGNKSNILKKQMRALCSKRVFH